MSTETGCPPFNWCGPEAAFYYSFDSSDGFVLMEGTQKMGPVPIINGQVIWINVEEIISV